MTKHIAIRTLEASFAVLFVWLAMSNIALRRQLQLVQNGDGRGRLARFHPGDKIPVFVARDRSNLTVRCEIATKPYVLVLFAPGCEPCENLLRTLVARPDPNVTLLSVAPLRLAFNDVQKIPRQVPVYFLDHLSKSPFSEKGKSVPQILRVEASGTVVETCRNYETCVAHLGI